MVNYNHPEKVIDMMLDETWLIHSKLSPPLLGDDLVVRPRLLASLSQARHACRLTLICAPAGYGKTTLLAGYQQENQISQSSALPLAWLSIDEQDNDLAIFCAYLIAAFQRIQPEFGDLSRSVLAVNNPGEAPLRRLSAALVNDLMQAFPCGVVLVLDDLHCLDDPQVFALLDHLLEHPSPGLHLAIGSRRDPPLNIARLRGRGQLSEWRAPQLCFSMQESEEFLNRQMGLQLTVEQLAGLQAQMEGWPAALRMLAQAMQRIPPAERQQWVSNVSALQEPIFEFLACEILERQLPEVGAFLLQTSIVNEITPDICQVVSGRADAGELLEDLAASGLLICVQPGGTQAHTGATQAVYRYHGLFARFLRQRLETKYPECVSQLHQSAAQAYGNSLHAIEHYLAAQSWGLAADVIEAIGHEVFSRGLINAAWRWANLLPAEVCRQRPRLAWFFGACALVRCDFLSAKSFLENALQGFEANQDDGGPAMAYVSLATNALLDADYEGAETLIHQALSLPAPRFLLAQSLLVRAWLAVYRADLRRAQADLVAAQEIAEGGADPMTWMTLGFALKNDFVVLPGGLARLEHLCRQVLVYVSETASPLALSLNEIQAFLELWRGRLKECIDLCQRALQLKEALGGLPLWGSDAAACALMAHAALGQYSQAEPYGEMLLAQLEQNQLGRAGRGIALYLVGHMNWRQGRFDVARHAYAQMCADANDRELPPAPALRSILFALLQLSERRYAAAENSLRQALDQQRTAPTTQLFASPALALARLHLDRHKTEQALVELRPILRECQQNGTSGIILKEGALILPVLRLAAQGGELSAYAAGLCALLDENQPAPSLLIPDTGLSLSSREMEVLRLMAQGANNRAIAAALVITERTVKAHVSNILHKLSASSRTQAVAYARQLGLV